MSWLRAHRVDLALVALVVACTAPIISPLMAQQASRLALTAAIWDDHSLRIDDYPIGVDHAEHDGHIYSDKAPGQPVLGIPAYAVYRAVGGEPARHFRVDGNLGLWAVTIWCCTIPIAVLVLLVRRVVDELGADGVVVAGVTFLGTLLLPFSSVLFGHALSAAVAFAGWYLVRRVPIRNGPLVASGALLGLAVLTEYTMLLVAIAVSIHVVLTVGGRCWRFALGALPAALALGWYQWAAFGSPVAFSYANSSFGSATAARGDEALDPTVWSNGLRVLVGERGLLVVTPVIAMGFIGLVALCRSSRGQQRSAMVAALAAVTSLVAVQVFWSNPTGGDSPGARYATAAAAFVTPGLAIAWGRWPLLSRLAAGVGAVIMLAATWTNPLEARDTQGAIGVWFHHLVDGELAPTVYAMALGSWARWLLPGLALGAGIVLVRAHAAERAVEAG